MARDHAPHSWLSARIPAIASAAAMIWALSACSGRIESAPDTGDLSSAAIEQLPTARPDGLSQPVESTESAWCRDGDLETGRVWIDRQALRGVSLYQGIEVPLLPERGGEVDVVAGRDALVRVFIDPQDAVAPHGARLTLSDSSGQQWSFDAIRPQGVPSDEADLATTYNFFLDGEYLTPTTSLRVELFRLANCATHEPVRHPSVLPPQGSVELEAREVGALSLVLVPVAFQTDGSGRLPDLGAEHLAELSSYLEAVYPISDVHLSIHDPVDTYEETLEGVLSQVMHLRESENPAPHVAYFGLVNPGPTMELYCGGTCVAGVSAVGSASGHSSSGVGIGFRGAAAETFIHELGHIHRLDHAPCGDPTGVDEHFPHRNAGIGSWGYDRRDGRLIDPGEDARDFMSYCDPTWISDYNYQNLIDRIALANSLPRADIVTTGIEEDVTGEPKFHILHVPTDGQPTWLAERRRAPKDSARDGAWRGAKGGWHPTLLREVFLSEDRGRLIYVPDEALEAGSLRLADGSEIDLP